MDKFLLQSQASQALSWLQFIALLTCTYSKSGGFSPIPTFNIRSCKLGAKKKKKPENSIAYISKQWGIIRILWSKINLNHKNLNYSIPSFSILKRNENYFVIFPDLNASFWWNHLCFSPRLTDSKVNGHRYLMFRDNYSITDQSKNVWVVAFCAISVPIILWDQNALILSLLSNWQWRCKTELRIFKF